METLVGAKPRQATMTIAYEKGEQVITRPTGVVQKIKELMSIADFGINEPAINSTFFPNTVADGYWSSTTAGGQTEQAWDMDFYHGGCQYSVKDAAQYVRPVRGGI